MSFLKQLIKNNTGVSIKGFLALSGMFIAFLMVLTIIIVLIVDLFSNYKVDTDLYGIAALIGSIAGFVLAAVWGKVKSESYENKDINNDEFIKP